jgi:hypothetical protein
MTPTNLNRRVRALESFASPKEEPIRLTISVSGNSESEEEAEVILDAEYSHSGRETRYLVPFKFPGVSCYSRFA